MPLIEDCAGLAGPEPQTWGTGLMNNTIFAGLDVHKEKIAVAVAEGGRGGEVRQLAIFLTAPITPAAKSGPRRWRQRVHRRKPSALR
jgi:hypothetical protein